MELQGIIKVIKPQQQITDKFVKREFVIQTLDKYPQSILLELQQDKVDLIDVYAEGQEVKCSIEIRGRLWTNPQGEDKYFNTIVCWKITTSSSESTAPTFEPVNEQPFQPTSTSEEEDNLPF